MGMAIGIERKVDNKIIKFYIKKMYHDDIGYYLDMKRKTDY